MNTVNMEKLNLCFFNCNGISNKIITVRDYTDKYNIDILMLQETHLKTFNRISFPNHFGYRNDSSTGRAKRGTAIFIKRNIPHCANILPPLKAIEATAIDVHIPGQPTITIISTYLPCNSLSDDVTSDLDTLFKINTNTILAGDFNAKHKNWGNTSNCPLGKTILNFANSKSIHIARPLHPTHHNRVSSTTIDFALISGINNNYGIQSIPELSSDHNPVNLTIDFRSTIQITNRIKHTNWQNFKIELNKLSVFSFNIQHPNDIDTAVNKLSSFITKTFENNSKPIDPNRKQYIPPYIRKIITERNRLKKRWQTSKDPKLKTELNRLCAVIRKELRSFSQLNWNSYLQSLNTLDQSLFRTVSSMKNKFQTIGPLITKNPDGTNNIISQKSNIAETIADSLQNQFTNNDIQHPDNEKIVTEQVQQFLQKLKSPNEVPVLTSEIISRIKKLKNRKAPGRDQITNKIVKNFTTNIVIILTEIINKILQFGHFPTQWKIARVVPIHKTGKTTTDPENYRPISLLPVLSKVAESAIHSRIRNHLQDNNIIIPQQFGFMPHHSTTQQLVRVIEYLQSNFNKKVPVGAVLLDICKAFDKVWLEGLFYKLITLKFPDYLITTIISYCSNRKFEVQIQDTISTTRNIQSGVAQGSLIGPLLFLIFINDIPTLPGKTILSLFADDTAIITKGNRTKLVNKLQEHLKLIEDWLTKWKIKLNVNKTEAIIFTRKRKSFKKLTLFNEEINWSNEVKYLGITLDKRLTYQKHISNVSKKFINCKRALYTLLGKHSKLTIKNKLLIYKLYLRPIISYAAPAFGYTAKSNFIKLQRLENILLRTITNARWFFKNKDIRLALNIPSFTEFCKKLTKRTFEAIESHPNPELENILNYDITIPSNKKRPKSFINYE